jgi:hypothetical protein
MKQITHQEVATIQLSSNPNKHNYYAIASNKTTTSVGFITQTVFEKGDFIVISNGGCTYGNGWDQLTSKTLVGCIETALQRNFVVFEFETYQELFTWLAAH